MSDRVAFRMFVDGLLIEEQQWDIAFVPDPRQLAISQSERLIPLAGTLPWHVEVEFLEEPSDKRFLRFGTDNRAMVDPRPFDDGELEGHPWKT